MRAMTVLLFLVLLGGCATQRFGRANELSAIERDELTCRDIRLETARNEQFLAGVREDRSGLNGTQVLGILGDFGIGNAMEGEAAEQSARRRASQLADLAVLRHCDRQVAAAD